MLTAQTRHRRPGSEATRRRNKGRPKEKHGAPPPTLPDPMAAPYDLAEAASHVAAADPALALVIERVGPCRLEVGRMADPFQALLRAIVYQQISGRAARAIHGRLLALFEPPHPAPEELLATPKEALRSAGLSRAKAAAAHDLAARVLDGTVPPLEALGEMEEAEILERLTAVRGVGPWTVQMLLLFQLGRPDVLPATDLGVRKGFMYTHGLGALPAPAELMRYGERWRPFRSVASWYLWRAAELLERLR